MCVIAALSCRSRHSRNADKPSGLAVASAARAHDLVCGFGFRRVGDDRFEHGRINQGGNRNLDPSVAWRGHTRGRPRRRFSAPGSVAGGAEAPESGLARKRRAPYRRDYPTCRGSWKHTNMSSRAGSDSPYDAIVDTLRAGSADPSRSMRTRAAQCAPHLPRLRSAPPHRPEHGSRSDSRRERRQCADRA